MSVDAALAQAMTDVPECVACGLVDLESGMLLGIKTVDSHPQEVIDLLSAATGEMFQGTNVVTIEKLFKKVRGVDNDEHYFREFIVNSKNLIHVFTRGAQNQEMVTVIITRVSANLGMVLNKSRKAAAAIEAAA